MASATDICNLALMHLKRSLRIGNIATDTTIVGQACATLYPLVRDKYQADRPWNFCKEVAALIGAVPNPNRVWAWSYSYPSDCLFLRRIQPLVTTPGNPGELLPSSSLLNFGPMVSPAQDTEQSAISFEVAKGLVYTNMPGAVAEYTQRNVTEDTWPAEFVLAMSYGMAAELAPILTDGDPFQLIEKMKGMAKEKMDAAAATNANERMRRQLPSEFTRMR